MAQQTTIFKTALSIPKPRKRKASDMGGSAEKGSVSRFMMETQLLDNWCWAAVTQSIEARHGRATRQIDIASEHTRRACSIKPQEPTSRTCGNPCSGSCDGQHSLGAILNQRDLLRDSAKNALPSFSHIRSEINDDRPVPVRIEWKDGGGHFVCATGWRIASDGREFVQVHDPMWPGRDEGEVDEQEMSYAVFVKNYVLTGDAGEVNFFYPLR